ncbi:MAG: hypothetical protein LYZ69_09400 [Nitrososphaerales archaeon]|nr:hypothetical protein [Nitrososphaerales archaeon]
MPTLRLVVSPPGYPIVGESWNVRIWQRVYPGQAWVPASNSTLLMISTAGNFAFGPTNGSVVVPYSSDLGGVNFLAQKSGFTTASWQPQTTFIQNDFAYLVMGFYIFGGGLSFYEISFEFVKRGRRNQVLRVISIAAALSIGTGYVLAVVWLQRWSFGTAWGFGNDILDGIRFDPDLLLLTAFNVVISSVVLKLQRAVNSAKHVIGSP